MMNERTKIQTEKSATEWLREKYAKSPDMIEAARQYLGLESDDTSQDAEILSWTPAKMFNNALVWEGLLGYGYQLRRWIGTAYGIDLTDDKTVSSASPGLRVIYDEEEKTNGRK